MFNAFMSNLILYPHTSEGVPDITKCMKRCSDTDGCKSITLRRVTGGTSDWADMSSSEMCYLYSKEFVDRSDVEVFASISANKECFDEIEGIELFRINLIIIYFIIFC